MTLTDRIRRLEQAVQQERDELLLELAELCHRAEEHVEAGRLFSAEKLASERLFNALRNAFDAAKGPKVEGRKPQPENGESVNEELARAVVEAREAAEAAA